MSVAEQSGGPDAALESPPWDPDYDAALGLSGGSGGSGSEGGRGGHGGGYGGDRMPPQDNDAEQSRARLDAAVQGRHRRRRRDRSAAPTSTGPRTRRSSTRWSTSTAAASRSTRSRSPPSCSRRGELARVGGAPYLHTLSASVPIAANAGYYAEIVREKAILRRLVNAGTKIVQMGYAGEGSVDDVVDPAQEEVYQVTDKRTSEDYAPLSAIMEATLDEIEAISNRGGEMTGVPDRLRRPRRAHQRPARRADGHHRGTTGGREVDPGSRSLPGGEHPRTTMASVIFSLEMTRNEITMRLLSAEAKIPLNHMRNGHMTDDDWTKLARKMGEVSAAPLFIDDSPEHDDDGDPGQGPPAQAAPRPAADRHRLPAADDLGQEGRVPPARGLGVLPPDQAARQGARRPGHRALAAQPWPRAAVGQAADAVATCVSRARIEQDADMVILLHREDVYEKESTRPGEADLIVAKHRNGPTRDVVVAFQGHYSRFVDMAQG